MPIDRPTPAELLAAVRQHMNEHLAPVLEGQPAFHLRVASNVLAIVERSLDEGANMDAAEATRLRSLLQIDGDLLDLNKELSSRIAVGEMEDQREELMLHLRQTAEDKLYLVNPRYMAPRD